MKRVITLISSLFLAGAVLGESQSIGGSFRGLNDGDSSFQIQDNEAQALLNVDITENASGIKKRSGYASYKTIVSSTHPVNGGYYFRNASGNEEIIHTNNRSIYKSVAGAAYSAFVTTDTVGSYYDFTDSQGYLWRATSNNDQILRWDGTTVTYYPSAPLGNQIEVLPDRMAISGVTGTPNSVNFSATADFTDYTEGTEETSAFTEFFGLPGQKVTAIKYAFGYLLVWTESTLSRWIGSNQFDGIIEDISTTIGTNQPNSIVYDSGLVYWQAQDKHFYAYDGNQVVKLSKAISGSVDGFAGGSSQNRTQTSSTDFGAGSLVYVSTSISSGDVALSTWTDTDTTTADFTLGTSSNTSVINNRVYLSTNNTNIDNNGFESGSGQDADSWTSDVPQERESGVAQSGTYSGIIRGGGSSPTQIYFYVKDASGNTLQATTYSYTSDLTLSTWVQKSVSLSSYAGRFIKIQFHADTSGFHLTSDTFLCSGSPITFWLNKIEAGSPTFFKSVYVDTIEGGRSTTYSGTFTSQTFDTAFSTAAWLSSDASWTTNSHAISVQTQSSPDGSTWDSAVAWTTGTAPGSDWDRYIRYVVTLSTGGSTNGTALPYVDDVTLSARASSGTFVSSVITVGSNITSWGNFGADQTLNSGTIGYFIRTASSEGGLSAASYTALTRDSQITASIGAYAQVKATFTITTATYDPRMHSFTINWDEGQVVRTFGISDVDHRVLWSVGEDGSATQNATYIYDTRFGSWLKYSVPFVAPAKVGSSIYFGSTSSGNVYNWPSGTSDNGSAITAYWKSKDFIGSDPFSEKDYLSYSVIALGSTGSNLDLTYTINTSSSITNNYSLTESNSRTFRNLNTHFPAGKFGLYLNMQFGNDDADAPFEVYALRYDYKPRPWRVLQ